MPIFGPTDLYEYVKGLDHRSAGWYRPDRGLFQYCLKVEPGLVIILTNGRAAGLQLIEIALRREAGGHLSGPPVYVINEAQMIEGEVQYLRDALSLIHAVVVRAEREEDRKKLTAHEKS